MTSEIRKKEQESELRVETVGPLQLLHGCFGDIDEFSAAPGPWAFEFQRLDRGASSVKLTQISTPGMLLHRFRISRRCDQRGSVQGGDGDY